ncbi:LiaI-LiaF-like domain-containing protein [Virgibacillus flavescens]|uniref:LiaI-LiaF-like domain-containing protein n=1 Tax=Virgibacillus flavescens TaxID=1611422 RepID=UPI003D349ED8
MKKQHFFAGYLLIGIGLYFLLKQLKLPIITDFYSWPTLFIIIGLAFLIHSYKTKDYQNLFSGTVILGLGIHFHGVSHYSFWIDHWGVYLLIVGIAFIVRFLKTKDGLFMGLTFIFLSLLVIFPVNLPPYLSWLYQLLELIENYWQLLLIGLGIFFLTRKDKKKR